MHTKRKVVTEGKQRKENLKRQNRHCWECLYCIATTVHPIVPLWLNNVNKRNFFEKKKKNCRPQPLFSFPFLLFFSLEEPLNASANLYSVFSCACRRNFRFLPCKARCMVWLTLLCATVLANFFGPSRLVGCIGSPQWCVFQSQTLCSTSDGAMNQLRFSLPASQLGAFGGPRVVLAGHSQLFLSRSGRFAVLRRSHHYQSVGVAQTARGSMVYACFVAQRDCVCVQSVKDSGQPLIDTRFGSFKLVRSCRQRLWLWR